MITYHAAVINDAPLFYRPACIVTEGKAVGHKRNPAARDLRTNPLFRARRKKSIGAGTQGGQVWPGAAEHKLGKPSGRDADAEDRFIVLGRIA